MDKQEELSYYANKLMKWLIEHEGEKGRILITTRTAEVFKGKSIIINDTHDKK